MRKKVILDADDKHLTFGKQFNEQFLRNGNSDDWINYLNKKHEAMIDKLMT